MAESLGFTVSPSPAVEFRERTSELNIRTDKTTVGAMVGVASWGPASQPYLVTAGEAEYVSTYGKPNEETYRDFMVASDFLSYTDSLYYVRAVGVNARNAVTAGTAPLVKNIADQESGNFVGQQFVAKYPGILGNSLRVEVADSTTFATWPYRNNFTYTPSAGEFAIAVVDTYGAWTGEKETTQVEKLRVFKQSTPAWVTSVTQVEQIDVSGLATASEITLDNYTIPVTRGDGKNKVAEKIATYLDGLPDYQASVSTIAGTDTFITSAIYGNGLYVIGGADGNVSVSADGIIYSQGLINGFGFGDTITALGFSNGRFMAGTSTGKIAISNDGKIWTQKVSPLAGTQINDFAFGGGVWVAVANGGSTITSNDYGATWVTQTDAFGGSDALSIGYAGTRFIAVGDNGSVCTSDDGGINWVSQVAPVATAINKIVTLSSSAVIAVGDDGIIITTNDQGATWISHATALGLGDNLTALASNGTRVVAFGNGLTYTAVATDLTVWTPTANQVSANNVYDATYVGNRLISFGGALTTSIIQSSDDVAASAWSIRASDFIDRNRIIIEWKEDGPHTQFVGSTSNGITTAQTLIVNGELEFSGTVDGNAVSGVITTADVEDQIAESIRTAMALDTKWSSVSRSGSVITATRAEAGVKPAVATVTNTGFIVVPSVVSSGNNSEILEKYEVVSTNPGETRDDGTSKYFVDAFLTESTRLFVGDPSIPLVAGSYQLSGGVDDNVNVDKLPDMAYLESACEQASYIITGDMTFTQQREAVEISERRKDTITFLSPQFSDVQALSGTERAAIEQWRDVELNVNSSYAFADDNWAYVWDKYNSVFRWIPCNGGTAGLKARTDATSYPWKSFAFHNRGVYRNYEKLAWNASKSDRDILYKKQINPIYDYPGGGKILYGDRTMLQAPSPFQKVTVRSLFLFMEKRIADISKFYLGEEHDPFTRNQFLSAVTPFLRNIEANRAFNTERGPGFQITCDATNNSQAAIDQGVLVGTIRVKPVSSINWVFLDFVADGSTVVYTEQQ